ncbi:MAG: hypothetical protein U0167_11045 [bacterium]
MLTRHLAGVAPSPYVVAQYVRAHEAGRSGPVRSVDDEDDPLVLAARGGPFGARLADAWAAAFDRTGPLRRKLVLLLALLESGRESDLLDRPGAGGISAFLRATTFRAAGYGLTLLAATFVVGPRVLVAGRRSRGTETP